MTTDDKFGIAAGLMALGLAAGIILLGQLTYDKDYEEAQSKAAIAAIDSNKDSKAVPPAPKTFKERVYLMFPHREKVLPEAIFDGIVCLLALPGGIVMFVLAIMGNGSSEAETVPGPDLSKPQPA